jgi:hypothetical protein
MAQDKVENGIIYREHPYIQIINHLFEFGAKGDTLAMRGFYADTALFFQSPDGLQGHPFENLNQVRLNWAKIYQQWEILSLVKTSPTQAYAYEDAPFTVKSTWEVQAIFRKTRKKASFHEVVFDEFNKDGKIIRETSFFDSSTFREAVLP